MKDVLQLDAEGYFVGTTVAQADPLCPGEWLMPPLTLDAPAPAVPPGQRAQWVGDDWQYAPAPVPPAPTVPEIAARIVVATQARLDAFARTRGYDNIMSACTYCASTDPVFAADGAHCVAARDATWRRLWSLLADVQAGAMPAPSCFADIEASLPALAWPSVAAA